MGCVYYLSLDRGNIILSILRNVAFWVQISMLAYCPWTVVSIHSLRNRDTHCGTGLPTTSSQCLGSGEEGVCLYASHWLQPNSEVSFLELNGCVSKVFRKIRQYRNWDELSLLSTCLGSSEFQLMFLESGKFPRPRMPTYLAPIGLVYYLYPQRAQSATTLGITSAIYVERRGVGEEASRPTAPLHLVSVFV